MNFTRTVAFISVCLGSLALIIAFAVLDGFEVQMHESASKFTSHIKLRTFNRTPIHNTDSLNSVLKKKYGVIKNLANNLEKEGILKYKDYIDGIVLRNYNPNEDISQFHENLIEGTFQFSQANSKEIVISKSLAQKANLSIGHNVFFYALSLKSATNLPEYNISKLKIIGIYHTGMSQYDDNVIFSDNQTITKLYSLPANVFNSISINLQDVNLAEEESRNIEKYLGYPYFAQSYNNIHSSMFTWIEVQKKPIPIVLAIISIVASLNILTSLLVAVVEKTYHIGILKSLGLSNNDIIFVFAIQGFKIGIWGTCLGIAIGLIICLIQLKFGLIKLSGDVYFLNTAPIFIDSVKVLTVAITSISLSALSTLLPAYLSTKISPISAIRFK